jgi:hypothetical protein
MPSDHGVEITGLDLAAGEGPLDGRQLEDGPEDRGHGPVAREGLVVEDEVLELAPLDGHEDRLVDRGEGGDDPLGTRFEAEALRLADADADPAPEAEVLVDLGHLLPRMGGIVGRNEGHRFDRTDRRAFAASRAGVEVDRRQKIRRMDGVEQTEAAGRDHGLAAAAAAVADEVDPPLDVLPELDEVMVVGLVEEGEPLRDVHGPGVAVADEGRGRGVEGHADVERGVAGRPDVAHLVAAVADPDAAMRSGLDDLARPLVVEDVEGVFVGEDGLVDEDPPELGLPLGEEGLDEVLLHGDVLVVELGQDLLVDVPPEPHHRELEEAGHGRRQDVVMPLAAGDIDENGPAGEGVEGFLGLGDAHLPGTGGLFHGERLEWSEGQERGLFLADEELENLEEELRGRGFLGGPVEPLDEAVVTGFRGHVGHGDLFISDFEGNDN